MGCRRADVLSRTALGIPLMLALPAIASAQYNCAVTIEWKGKAILAGEIRDTDRPPTDQLWELLKTLSFAPARDAKDLPDPKAVAQATLKGELRVKINGAGEVPVAELRLVRNPFNPGAWVIAPDEVTRIVRLRK